MFPPLTTGYEGRDGSITPQCIDFYERLAEGGVGYIVIGDVAPINSFLLHQNYLMINKLMALKSYLIQFINMELRWGFRYFILNMIVML